MSHCSLRSCKLLPKCLFETFNQMELLSIDYCFLKGGKKKRQASCVRCGRDVCKVQNIPVSQAVFSLIIKKSRP